MTMESSGTAPNPFNYRRRSVVGREDIAAGKPSTSAAGLVPEHFTAYMRHMVDDRKLGRVAR
jgi:hypothetical protein